MKISSKIFFFCHLAVVGLIFGNIHLSAQDVSQPNPVGATSDAEVEKMLKIGVPEEKPAKNDGAGNNGLPRVLLIGDSISGAYFSPVAGQLKGKAFVKRGDSGGPSTAGLAKIDQIVSDGPWDVIHFNWGLHDMTWQFKWPEEQQGISKYAERLDTIVKRLKETGADLIWATTTPWCPETYEYAAKRYKQNLDYPLEEQMKWQNAALEVMKKHGVRVNDLHALLQPKLGEYLKKPDDIHFNQLGTNTMAKQIAAEIEAVLNERGSR